MASIGSGHAIAVLILVGYRSYYFEAGGRRQELGVPRESKERYERTVGIYPPVTSFSQLEGTSLSESFALLES